MNAGSTTNSLFGPVTSRLGGVAGLSARLPWPLLVVIGLVTPLTFSDWMPGDAEIPSSMTLSSIQATTVPYLPITPVDERDLPPPRFTKTVEVGKGDTLIALLTRQGLENKEAHLAIKALSKHYNPRKLRPGQELELVFDPQSSKPEDDRLSEMIIRPDIYHEINLVRLDEEVFEINKRKTAVEKRLLRATGKIESSLYVAATDAGVPVPVLMELIRIYSWDVDFQRGIRSGDEFEIVYENLYTEDMEFARHGQVLFGSLTLSGDKLALYRHKTSKNLVDYFDEKGHAARKALMRTPINGARLSSGFGRRKHPILGYTKVHRGVDFAAPRGTPIYAGGSGTVVARGRNGGYGNYIRIRHTNNFQTAYAHMSRIHTKVLRGSRVRQGQIIGYVGSTGRSTGPHLHYEIIKNGRQVNPLRIKMPSGQKLKGQELVYFNNTKKIMDRKRAELPASTKLAQKKAKLSN
ncbi:MAG: M23 family metallopeptidase [Rhodospirillaceae bacterium]